MDGENKKNNRDNESMDEFHVDENAVSESGLSNDDDPASLTVEDRIENARVQALIKEINTDIEDDLYGRDGDTNDSELAPQRLEALSGRLKGAFAQAASQLLTVVGTAMEKKAIAEKAKDQADILDTKEKKKQEAEKEQRADMEDALDDIAQTTKAMSQTDLDDMAWEGDPNEQWSFGAKSGSRKSWYEAAKATRKKLDKLAAENNWTPDERAQQELYLSDYMKALKTNDAEAARKVWEKMKPETQQAIAHQQNQEMEVLPEVSKDGFAEAYSKTASTDKAIDARTDILAQAAPDNSSTAPVERSGPTKETALLNPPDVKLTEEFSLAATDEIKPATPTKDVQLAVANAPKAAAPVLSQEFSI